MESITIKVEESLGKEIEKAMNPDYSTKTEFIREAIRDKLKALRKDKILEELKRHLGKAKRKTTSKEEKEIRESVAKAYLKKHGILLD